MCLIVSIINHKGGSGKTTTAINLGKGLSLEHKRVLLVDLDPQSNLSYWTHQLNSQVNVETLVDRAVEVAELPVFEGMWVLPGVLNSNTLEYRLLFNEVHDIFKTRLHDLAGHFDYVFIDCPPSKSELSITALYISDAVLIPVLTDVLSLQGLNQILETYHQVKENLNGRLEIIGVLPVMVDERRALTREVLEILSRKYQLHVFNNYIRNNVRAAEAPSFGQSLVEYSPKSNSAVDYLNMSSEFMKITLNKTPFYTN